jgi:hypothetical protein
MKADNHQSASSAQAVHALRQDTRKLVKFLVEINPYSLKGSRRRILPGFARADGLGNKLAELQRGSDG